MHQCVKVEPNWSTDGTVIGANAHTHSPLHKLYIYHKFMHFILEYLSVYLFLEGERKFPEVYRPYFTHTHTSKLNAFNYQIKIYM